MSSLSPIHQYCHYYSPQELEVFEWIQTGVQPPKPIIIAISLIKIFGIQHAKAVESNLKDLLKPASVTVYKMAQDSIHEIADYYRDDQYSADHFPKTAKLIAKCFEATNKQESFSVLRNEAADIFPFLQTSGIYGLRSTNLYRNREAKLLLGFDMLDELLSPSIEHKRAVSHKVEDMRRKMAFIELVCARDAIRIKEISYSYADLVATWIKAPYRPVSNQEGFGKWKEVGNGRVIEKFQEIADKGFSWRQFLAECTIQAIEENLDLKFWPLVREELLDLLLNHNELIRSDLAFFTGYVPLLVDFEFDSWPRTGIFLRAFQRFITFSHSYGVPKEKRSFLFSMIYKTLNIKMGKSVQPKIEEESPEFAESWNHLESLLSISLGYPVSLFNSEIESHLDKSAFALFLRLMKNPNCLVWIDFFQDFCKQTGMQIPLYIIDRFWEVNKYLKEIELNCFKIEYIKTINIIRERRGELDFISLFFSPVIQINSTTIFFIGEAAKRTEEFLKCIDKFSIKKGWQIGLLRHFIFNPNFLIFDLFDQACVELDLKITSEESLYRIFSYSKNRLPSTLFPLIQEQGLSMTKVLLKRYPLQSEQTFFLYLEILTTLFHKQTEYLRHVSWVVEQLEALTGGISSTIVYYLYLYPPLNSLEAIYSFRLLLEEWRLDWNKNRRNPEKIAEADASIGIFATELTKSCKDVNIQSMFYASVEVALRMAFYPNEQPLEDHLNLHDLSPIFGPRWASSYLQTHLGQLKLMSDTSSQGIYLRWEIRENYPVCFLTCFNLRTQTGHSFFIQLPRLLSSIRSSQEMNFFSFLGQYALGKRDQISMFKVMGWLSLEEIECARQFIDELKTAYQRCFFEPSPEIDPKETAFQVAAKGHIFRSDQKSYLIPHFYLSLEPHPEFYEPVVFESDQICSFMVKFRRSTLVSTFLGVSMVVTEDGQNRKEVPIQVRVQSKEPTQEGLFVKELPAGRTLTVGKCVILGYLIEGEKNLIEIPLLYPPKAFESEELFRKHLDFHTLLVKGSWYFQNQRFKVSNEPDITKEIPAPDVERPLVIFINSKGQTIDTMGKPVNGDG